ASTTESSYPIKACIYSEADIKTIKVYVNGKSYVSRGLGVESDCSEMVNQSISLDPGQNKVEIEVITNNNSAMSELRTIEYKAKSSGNYHALIIGIQNYDDMAIRDLEKPIADATSFQQTLTNNYTFESGDVYLLKNPTKDNIIDKLVYLQERLGENDNLLIFYSGHGVVKNDIGYWLPSDAKQSSRSSWLSNAELREYINSINTKHTLVIADACFSGAILNGGYRDINQMACEQMARVSSRRAMTSGAGTIVPDESIFFKYLVQKLKENTSGCVSAEALYSKIKPAVIYNSPNNQIPQFGILPQTGDEGGNFVFIRR
ncbi:MAG: caspase family protein, partial [Saprospiraceae bacterium]|nr:caspase family protein [Saprospiraceae bacterium]